jgi:hypothetical protein
MIIDSENEFSDEQELTATADSANVLDFGADGDAGKELYALMIVILASDSADDGETCTAAWMTASESDFSDAVALIPAVSFAQLPAGSRPIEQRIPVGLMQYNKIVYTIGGTTLTVDPKVSFMLVEGTQTNVPANIPS